MSKLQPGLALPAAEALLAAVDLQHRELQAGAEVAPVVVQPGLAQLGPPGLVVSFLAVLELVKEKLVEVTQYEAFAPVYVKMADGTRNDA